MKILIVTGIFPPDIGGPASYVPEISEALIQRGHRVQVITLSDDICHHDDIYSFPVIRLFRGSFRIKRVLRSIYKIIEKGKGSDLLFVNGLALESVIANWLIQKPMVQKVVGDLAWERARTFRGVTDTLEVFQNKKYSLRIEIVKKLRTFWVRKSSMVITPSDYLKRVVSEWGISDEKIKVIYNAVDLPLPEENRVSDELSKKGIYKNIVSVGRLVPWKGFNALICVMAEIPEARLTIIGEGPERAALTALIAEKGLKERVFLPGAFPRCRVLEYLGSAELFVLNSSYEGLPHIVLEAMAASVPVVATDTGGTGELVMDECNGLLIRTNDPKSLKNAILRLFQDDALKRELVEKGKETIKKFKWEDLVEKTEAVLLEAVERF